LTSPPVILTQPRITKVIVSHDLELIEALCPRLIILKQGKVLADGPTATIMAEAELLVAGGLAAAGR
jgi:cobalt/nickel transport system ATP-binding protein